jgi:hypothetical protein
MSAEANTAGPDPKSRDQVYDLYQGKTTSLPSGNTTVIAFVPKSRPPV